MNKTPRKAYLGKFTTRLEPSPTRPVLTWRLPPGESLSDWKIQIRTMLAPPVANGDAAPSNNFVPLEAVYHVHSYVLGVGSRRSDYFVHLFEVKNMIEHDIKTSTIELDEAAADAFPAMLDFMYDPSKDAKIKTPTQAAALRHLSSYFGIQELFDNVNDTFIQNGLDMSTVFEYMEAANVYQDEDLVHAAIDALAARCPRSFDSLISKKILALPLEWFSRLAFNAATFHSVAILLATYIESRPEGLTAKHVAKLMRRVKNTKIPSSQAPRLYQIAAEYNLDDTLKNRLAIAYVPHWAALAQALRNPAEHQECSVYVSYKALPDAEKLRALEMTFCQTARKLTDTTTPAQV
jgi:hypothetical protein